MNEVLDERLRLESALHVALKQQDFELHYQPKVHMADGSIAGVEALLRWTEPGRGPVSPEVFIPVAEECGLVDAIDAWVLSQACEQLAAWRVQGVPITQVAVNVSPTRFLHDDVAAHVRRLLRQHELKAGQLTLEITERWVMGDEGRTQTQLETLHRMGVRLSVDDFGTGYSSLGYLKRLPVSEIKLDRSFVRDMEVDADDRALANAVISVGKALGLDVVAEGVETAAQHRLLMEAGCVVAQGYHYGRPQPAPQLAQWLARAEALPARSL